MKSILLILVVALSSTTVFAADSDQTVALSFSTQAKIIEAFLNSNTAQTTEVGNASVSEVMERDLSVMMSGSNTSETESNTVTLKCTKKFETVLSCSLNSFYIDEVDGETYESSIILQGDVYLPTLSTEVSVQDVTFLIAG